MSRFQAMNALVKAGQLKNDNVFQSASTARALPLQERQFFEARLGRDFSNVRVHTDEKAAAWASALGAKAFSVGADIVFAQGNFNPGSKQGRELLSHEMLHVAQQHNTGSGSAVNAESAARASASSLAQGNSLSVQQQGAAATGVYCEDDDKKKAAASAPKSAGDKKNTSAAKPAPTASQPPTTSQPPSFFPGAVGLQPPSNFQLRPPFLSPELPPKLTPNFMRKPPEVSAPYKLMVNADILSVFGPYGTSPAMQGFDMHSDWANAYFMFRNYLPENLAATSANIFLGAAYKSALARDNPNIFDKSDAEFKAAYPDATGIPPLPIISSGTMTTLYELISGKKDTHAFYF